MKKNDNIYLDIEDERFRKWVSNEKKGELTIRKSYGRYEAMDYSVEFGLFNHIVLTEVKVRQIPSDKFEDIYISKKKVDKIFAYAARMKKEYGVELDACLVAFYNDGVVCTWSLKSYWKQAMQLKPKNWYNDKTKKLEMQYYYHIDDAIKEKYEN